VKINKYQIAASKPDGMKNKDLLVSPQKTKSFMTTYMNKMLKDKEFKTSQVPFIIAIGSIEGSSMKELSIATGSDKGLTTRVVQTLIENGFVKNKSESSRTYELYLTEKGREAYDVSTAILDQTMDIIFGCLDEEDLKNMRIISAKINKRLDESYKY
jgi:DNA-binding MarR family transcriptional regulator